ncbi:hypothetical protein QVH35_08095 [Candidatus Nitrosotenuis chungbukensis]|uniref:hypothetical protein n=1 Tax=Candidatus Nitrosotenuis chungbukensis TaxID=1353246 RepID=UPI0005B2B853|nr:hypothetical protein [Candidatus Nitrosotenuis chungbukensis]WKT57357.1 hypothetical protein QVH35_08095 [Candidatus Nitrosotenuis chungbukensis]
MIKQSISAFILEKMYRNRIIGGRHVSLEDLRTGCPSHERGNIEKTLKKLVKENLVVQHPTSYGMQYALNPQRIDEIMKILNIG